MCLENVQEFFEPDSKMNKNQIGKKGIKISYSNLNINQYFSNIGIKLKPINDKYVIINHL